MKFPRLLVSLSLFLVCLVAFSAAPAFAGSDDWKPLTPAELALKSPVVEKDADAEALFWDVRVDDDPEGDVIFTHYLRIKVFTERGRESQSKIDIPFGKIYSSDIRIKDIAARTIKPDGSIVELKKEDIFERSLIKASGLKVKNKSFAMPSVEPGSIIEYRWREVRVNQLANYVRLQFQRDIPVQRVTYHIKPYPFPDLSMRWITFHGQEGTFVKEKDGFFANVMTNMPAFREEPRMPPEDEVRTWMLIYYARAEQPAPDKFWNELGKRFYSETKSLMKVSDEVRSASVAAIGDASAPEEKLDRLFNFVRAKIKNTSDDASGFTAEDRAKMKNNKSPSDTLKRGVGSGGDLDLLFAALATAAGFDARIVLAGDRSDMFFDKGFANPYFINPSSIAVRVGDHWRFYNPGYNYIQSGTLRWQEEGIQALITDPKEPVWVKTPITPFDKTVEKRTARLALSEDGTLEGDVRIEYTGHLAVDRKEYDDDDSLAEREQTLRNSVKANLSTAEISNIKIENVTDPVKPFIYAYHVRVPGYAQRTGKRLFLQPAFFEHGVSPIFAASQRKNLIYFKYPWSESDQVIIDLPAGFALDSADAPAPFAAKGTSDYKVDIGVTKDGKTLSYTRSFYFNGLLYPVSSYTQLKQFFEMVNKADNHTITLKQATTTAAN
jgi:hypothetical protein